MQEQSASERTEDATPKRRREAREKGTVAKSTDLTNSLILLFVSLAFSIAFARSGLHYINTLSTQLSQIPYDLNLSSIYRYVVQLSASALGILAPLIFTAMVIGLIVNFAQVGFFLSPQAIIPSFSKLDPIAGFKRLLSLRSVVEAIKAGLKSFLFGYLAWTVIWSEQEKLSGLSLLHPTISASIIGHLIGKILFRISIAWLVLSVLDYYFQRKQIDKQLKMTKDELKKEMREQEASPELRSTMAARRKKLARARIQERVPKADVVITNPQHFAVAIKYERNKMHAPMVVAKGQDYLALRIREIAKKSRVPIVPNPPLARTLYKKCEVGDFIPRELYQAVAEVLAYVYRVVQRMK